MAVVKDVPCAWLPVTLVTCEMRTLSGCSPVVSVTTNSSPKSQNIWLLEQRNKFKKIWKEKKMGKRMKSHKRKRGQRYSNPQSPLVLATINLTFFSWQWSPNSFCTASGVCSSVSVRTTTYRGGHALLTVGLAPKYRLDAEPRELRDLVSQRAPGCRRPECSEK